MQIINSGTEDEIWLGHAFQGNNWEIMSKVHWEEHRGGDTRVECKINKFNVRKDEISA